jgi:hypothetical protein
MNLDWEHAEKSSTSSRMRETKSFEGWYLVAGLGNLPFMSGTQHEDQKVVIFRIGKM